MELSFERIPAASKRLGHSVAELYARMHRGTVPPVVKLGVKISGLPTHEVDAIIRARIAGRSESEIKALVTRLVAERTQDVAA